MTYAEYLRSQGATEEDIKVMDNTIGRKAFDKLQADAAAAAADAKTARDNAAAYEERVNGWFETHEKEYKGIESKLVASEAERSKAVTALKIAHERGMIDVAKDLGYNFDAPVTPTPRTEVPPVDTSKFISVEQAALLMEKEGEAIATMSDIAAEHVYLFGAPLRNARELRKEAVQRKIPVEAVWQEKYGVQKARSDKEAAATLANEERIRKDEREKLTVEFASKYGNPETRPLTESRSFLIPRKDSGRDAAKQPWEANTDGEGGSNDRVRRAAQNALKAQVTTH